MEKEDFDLKMKRHSLSHVLAAAVCSLFENVQIAIGPAIDNGFYYDFDMPTMITQADFAKIEKEMKNILNKSLPFERVEVSKEEALELFKNQPYKTELINDFQNGEVISTYRMGDFVDLCAGPHVENTSKLQNWGFKIERVSGAYWKGSEKNKMLQRVYCFAFKDKKQLAEFVFQQEEAKKRDHRKLGREQELFFISEYAQGMPFFMPKGVEILNTLTSYWREEHKKAGYQEIITPMAMSRSLWETSGHWGHYRDNMYSFAVEDDTFAIKPMNCPGGMLFYQEKMRSYRDFPLRVGELGKVHRHEASGTLHGLFRVRCFTQDDAHIFMTKNQIESEVVAVMELVDKMYATFGLTYHLELSTMPEDHIGEVEDWKHAEKALENALKSMGREFVVNEGDGAFYGPKIDIHIKDAIGRTWQCGTIQLDMQLPKRFNLEFVDADGTRKEPVMIHRVVFGSIERFFGVLTENFAGIFPVWLAPVQVKVLNISVASEEYAKAVHAELLKNNIKAELDVRNEKIGYKIRESISQKIPYIIVLGESEATEKTITVRKRKNVEEKNIPLAKLIEEIKEKISTRALD